MSTKLYNAYWRTKRLKKTERALTVALSAVALGFILAVIVMAGVAGGIGE